MNLDELKTAWQLYDAKLNSSKLLNDRIIASMIKEKSQSRLSSVKNKYSLLIVYLSVCFFAGAAVLACNPFDYQSTVEYLPVAIYCMCLMVLIIAMVITNRDLQKIDINRDNLDGSLSKVIGIVEKYEHPNKLLGWTLRIFLISTTLLFPLSFLPRKIESVGLWPAIVDTIIPIAISVALLFIAFKLGAFKERNVARFKAYLEELNELKELSKELKSA